MSARESNDPPTAFEAMFANAGIKLNVQEVADLLGMNRQTILNWIARGVIPAYRLSKDTHWFVFRDEIKEVLINHRNAFDDALGEDFLQSTDDEQDGTRN